MRTRYGVPFWLDRYPKARQPSYPRHRGALDVQVAMLGGGLTGCSTAYVFAAAGVRVALVEANRIGQGGSASCPGLLRLEPAVPFDALKTQHGHARGAAPVAVVPARRPGHGAPRSGASASAASSCPRPRCAWA